MIKKRRRIRRRKSRFHTGIHVSPKAGECRFRSGWEFNYMKYLDEDPDVVSYEYEKLAIPYVSNVRTKKMRKYLPDFVVVRQDGKREVVEIKQSRRVLDPKIVKKTLAARDWCSRNDAEYTILTEIELKSMGIL